MKVRLETPIEKAKKEKLAYRDRDEEWYKRQLFKEDSQENTPEIVLEDKANSQKVCNTGDWDVPIGYEIKYFDPELSYELTGYRPITMEKGLDFDPDLFREDAINFDRTGQYTSYPPGCKPYMDFWKERYKRCREGYTVGKYRITGDQYFFINFYRMFTINEGSVSGTGRGESFPAFAAKQYEFAHYCEMAEILHKDIGILKGRGVGLSEWVANMAVRPYTTNRGYRTLLTCSAETKLQPLRDKCWLQLDWLNRNTDGGMRHLRQKFNSNSTKRASLVTPDGIEYGWRSEIDSVVADTSDKIRGSRCDRLIFEEAGADKNLAKSWIQGAALVELGGEHFGTRVFLGTGGQPMALEGLRTMFLDPAAFNILPYKNYYTDDGKPELTAFFLPSHTFGLKKEFVDNRGVTNSVALKAHYQAQRDKLHDQALIDECAEHCFIPREALANHGDNLFDALVLSERLVQIKTNQNYTRPKRIQLQWDKAVGNGMQKIIARESELSPLLIVEPPITDETGQVYKNLYVAGIDAIDMGRGDSATDNDVSDFCIVIKKRQFGMQDPKYVAMYKYRPNDIRQAYDVALKLLTWYNCKAMLEYTKISIQTYFKDKGKIDLFMQRPEFAVSTNFKRRTVKKLIGIPSTDAVIKHGLELVAGFINDYWWTIDYEDMVDQMLNYSYENKRKFDIIAALQCCEIGDEELSGVTPSKVQSISNQWKDFGYYIDKNGYKRKGVIPTK